MPVGVQICSGAEWRATKTRLTPEPVEVFPYGEYFHVTVAGRACVFFHSRRTKTRSAGACQYAIDHWGVDPVVVLGTCGGVAERLRVMDIVFATRTVHYDCVDRMFPMKGPFFEMMTAAPDLSWLSLSGLEGLVHPGTVATADHDLTFEDLEFLRQHDVVGADWESGAIGVVCALNRVRWAVFRGVTDVPVRSGGEDATRQGHDYVANTPVVMEKLLSLLPTILEAMR